MSIEIFKTDVDSLDQARAIIQEITNHYPHLKVNFDLEDCDKILRVENLSDDTNEIIEIVKKLDTKCEILN